MIRSNSIIIWIILLINPYLCNAHTDVHWKVQTKLEIIVIMGGMENDQQGLMLGHVLTFIDQIPANFELASDWSRISIVPYGNTTIPDRLAAIPLTFDMTKVKKFTSNPPHFWHDGTYGHSALLYVRDKVFATARLQARKLIVFFYFHSANPITFKKEAVEAAEELREMNSVIYIVHVQDHAPTTELEDLKLIAKQPDRVIQFADAAATMQSIKDDLNKSVICEYNRVCGYDQSMECVVKSFFKNNEDTVNHCNFTTPSPSDYGVDCKDLMCVHFCNYFWPWQECRVDGTVSITRGGTKTDDPDFQNDLDNCPSQETVTCVLSTTSSTSTMSTTAQYNWKIRMGIIWGLVLFTGLASLAAAFFGRKWLMKKSREKENQSWADQKFAPTLVNVEKLEKAKLADSPAPEMKKAMVIGQNVVATTLLTSEK